MGGRGSGGKSGGGGVAMNVSAERKVSTLVNEGHYKYSITTRKCMYLSFGKMYIT